MPLVRYSSAVVQNSPFVPVLTKSVSLFPFRLASDIPCKGGQARSSSAALGARVPIDAVSCETTVRGKQHRCWAEAPETAVEVHAALEAAVGCPLFGWVARGEDGGEPGDQRFSLLDLGGSSTRRRGGCNNSRLDTCCEKERKEEKRQHSVP